MLLHVLGFGLRCVASCSNLPLNLCTPLSFVFFIDDIVNRGTGFEARQTSKEQTKMPRFMLESP